MIKKIDACCRSRACECPRQATDYMGSKYEIDQEKCIPCGFCAKVCHTGACHEEPRNTAAVQPHPPVVLDCDVVVVGSGPSGLSAARFLADCAMRSRSMSGIGK